MNSREASVVRAVKQGESEIAQSCPTLCNPMDCSLPGSSVHGISQARVLEWGAIAFSDKHTYSNPILKPGLYTVRNYTAPPVYVPVLKCLKKPMRSCITGPRIIVTYKQKKRLMFLLSLISLLISPGTSSVSRLSLGTQQL